MHNLAVLYAEGVDGKPDYQTAARWFRKAADHGVVDSQYNLAILYARGIGVETNLAEAFKWFALASREGDREAASEARRRRQPAGQAVAGRGDAGRAVLAAAAAARGGDRGAGAGRRLGWRPGAVGRQAHASAPRSTTRNPRRPAQ